MFDHRVLALFAALGLILLSAGSAAAASETETERVETPAGTYYVTADAEVDPPSFGWGSAIICIEDGSGFQWCPVHWPKVDEGGVSVDVGLYEETNECDGLQEEPQDCTGDGATNDPDESVVGEGLSV